MTTALHQVAARWAVPTIGAVMFLALVIAGLTLTSGGNSQAEAARGQVESRGSA